MEVYGKWTEQESTVFRTSSDNKELTVTPPTSLTGASLTLTLPDVSGTTDTLVSATNTATLTNKTLTSPVISTISNTGTLTLPTATDTLVGRDTTDTLTNKTIDGDDNTVQDLALGVLKTTANTNVFLQRDGSGDVIDSAKAVPAGDVVGNSDTQTLTNKTIDADSNTISNIDNDEIKASAGIALDKLAAATANRALASDGSGFIVASTVTDTELGYLSGVTSAIQTQLQGKQDDVITTRGDTIIGDASGDAVRLPVGTVGQVLTTDGTDVSWASPAGTGDVTAAANIADNALVRGDGGAKGIQQSGISIDDSDNVTGVAGLTASGTVEGGTITDGTLSSTSGSITGAVDISMSGDLTISNGTPRLTLEDTNDTQTYFIDTVASSGRLNLFSSTDSEFLLSMASSSQTGGNPLIQIGHTTGSNDVRFEGFGTGIAHLDASGNLSSSAIVNADVSASAAIAGTKIDPDFGSQAIETTGDIIIDANGIYLDSTNQRIGIGTAGPLHSIDARYSGASQNVLDASAIETGNSYAGIVVNAKVNRTASSAFDFFRGTSDADGTPDVEFQLSGNGSSFQDGGTTWGTPADYAEMFEWADGNPSNEDRVGMSVSLTSDGKIKEAEEGETPIGVISGNPAVLADAAWNRWAEKYLKDEYNRYVLDEDGHRVLNPQFDPEAEYVPRIERPEWSPVGLLGKLSIKKDQIKSDTWIKLGNISDTVERWLVK